MSKKQINYLGIDWGEKRIGLALGSSETVLATPFKIVKNIKEILEVIKTEEINKIILGKPIKMSGQSENLTEKFEKFVEKLLNNIKIPVDYIDERLTSKAADALEGDKKSKASRDAIAAMLILQSYLDSVK